MHLMAPGGPAHEQDRQDTHYAKETGQGDVWRLCAQRRVHPPGGRDLRGDAWWDLDLGVRTEASSLWS